MSASTIARLSAVVLMLALAANAITVEDVYKRLLERERTAGSNPFSGHFIRPIGSVGDELVSGLYSIAELSINPIRVLNCS